MKTLIHGGYLIPMAGAADVVGDGALVIENDRILAVGTSEALAHHKEDAGRVINARGHAILPGFVNTHTHLAGALTKALTEDVPTFGGPFRIALGMHENVITKDDMLLPGMVHGVEMLKTGTTTINECWWHQPQSARIIRDVGLRGVVGAEIREVDSSKIGFGRVDRNWDSRLVEEGLEEAEELFENWHGKGDGRITCRVAPDGPDRLRPETLGRLGDLARKHGVGLHTHLCSVPGENEFMLQAWGKKSIPLLKELGLLGPDFIGAHCVFVDEEDIEIMVRDRLLHVAYRLPRRQARLLPADEADLCGGDAGLAGQRLALQRHVQGDALGHHPAARGLPRRQHPQCPRTCCAWPPSTGRNASASTRRSARWRPARRPMSSWSTCAPPGATRCASRT